VTLGVIHFVAFVSCSDPDLKQVQVRFMVKDDCNPTTERQNKVDCMAPEKSRLICNIDYQVRELWGRLNHQISELKELPISVVTSQRKALQLLTDLLNPSPVLYGSRVWCIRWFFLRPGA